MIGVKKILCICVLIWIGAESISAQHHSHHHSHGHSHDHDHHHDHGHVDEPPSYRYSQEANQARHSEPTSSQPAKQPQQHNLPPKLSKKARSFEDTALLWGRALGSTVLISIAPFLILFFIPIDSRSGHESFLKVLLSFASGGLLGDAFLHLIPHALIPHDVEEDHTHSHSHSDGSHGHGNSVGLWVLAGILTFLVVEKIVRMIKGGHSHGHSHEKKADEDSKPKGKCDGESSGGEDVKTSNDVVHRKKEKLSEVAHAGEAVADEKPDIKVAAYLNLAADFTHNFTDGLAIGASYIAGNAAGFISTITILLHEVPHEIGDFAILVQAGYSKRKAMLMQLVTAFGCLSGTLCSLVVEGMTSSASSWVLPFTAGGFIYIATVSVIPELLENTSLRQSVKEVFALIVGVFMMAMLTQFE